MNDIQQKKQELNDLHSFIRGKTYSREKHIQRRFRVLGSDCNLTESESLALMDKTLHLDFQRVGKIYVEKFHFDHFTKYFRRYQQYDKKENPRRSEFPDIGNLFTL